MPSGPAADDEGGGSQTPTKAKVARTSKLSATGESVDNKNVKDLYQLPLAEKRELLYIMDPVEFNHEVTSRLDNEAVTDAWLASPSIVGLFCLNLFFG